jgi:hypothetical protein
MIGSSCPRCGVWIEPREVRCRWCRTPEDEPCAACLDAGLNRPRLDGDLCAGCVGEPPNLGMTSVAAPCNRRNPPNPVLRSEVEP